MLYNENERSKGLPLSSGRKVKLLNDVSFVIGLMIHNDQK